MQTVPENGTFIDLTELLKQEEINEKKKCLYKFKLFINNILVKLHISKHEHDEE